MPSELSIRQMRRDELDLALDWAAAENWNPGLNDADAFFATDAGGFLIGEADGEVVGSISAISYGNEFGFIGMFIVRPEHRHRGYGLKLGSEAMRRLGDRNIGVDGVVERQKDYEKAGFKFCYRNVRYEVDPKGARGLPRSPLGLARNDIQVSNFDRRFFPAERKKFLDAWLSMPNAHALMFSEDGKVKGYGVIRSCRHGFKIGPLFAENADVADELFLSLAAHANGAPIYIDMPEPNAEAMRMAKRYKMQKVFETARMYTRGAPSIDLNGIFGITTFELG